MNFWTFEKETYSDLGMKELHYSSCFGNATVTCGNNGQQKVVFDRINGLPANAMSEEEVNALMDSVLEFSKIYVNFCDLGKNAGSRWDDFRMCISGKIRCPYTYTMKNSPIMNFNSSGVTISVGSIEAVIIGNKIWMSSAYVRDWHKCVSIDDFNATDILDEYEAFYNAQFAEIDANRKSFW